MPTEDFAPPLKTTHVMVRMTPELHAAAKARADEEDRPLASLIRRAIVRYLEGLPRG